MDKITNLREVIDEIDNELMRLLSKRYEVSIEIGKLKSNSNKEILDRQREDYILGKTLKYSHSSQIKEVYKTIMSESKNIQKR